MACVVFRAECCGVRETDSVDRISSHSVSPPGCSTTRTNASATDGLLEAVAPLSVFRDAYYWL